MTYDDSLKEAEEKDMTVREKPLRSAKGRIYGKRIAIQKGLSQVEKTCVLAEELGHFETTVGNILDHNNTNNRKQEKTARKWAIDKMISIEDIFRAAEQPCSTLFEIAEYLEVTEEFLLDALEVFKKRYGHSYTHEGKTIVFCDRGFCIK